LTRINFAPKYWNWVVWGSIKRRQRHGHTAYLESQTKVSDWIDAVVVDDDTARSPFLAIVIDFGSEVCVPQLDIAILESPSGV